MARVMMSAVAAVAAVNTSLLSSPSMTTAVPTLRQVGDRGRDRGRGGGTCLIPSSSLSSTTNALVLDFEALRPDLKAVHGLDGSIRSRGGVIRHKPKSLTLPRVLIHIHLRTDHSSERIKCSRQVSVGQIMRQMVNKQICTRRPFQWLRPCPPSSTTPFS